MNRFALPIALFALLVVVLAIGIKHSPDKGVIASPLIDKPAPQFSLPSLADATRTHLRGPRSPQRSRAYAWWLAQGSISSRPTSAKSGMFRVANRAPWHGRWRRSGHLIR